MLLLICFLLTLIILIILFIFYKQNMNKCDDINIIFSDTKYINKNLLTWNDIKDNINKNAELYLSIVIPAYNEEKRIINTMNSIITYMENRGELNKEFKYEIIVVDDGSKDNTLKVCKELWLNKKIYKDLNGRLLLLSSQENHGKGNAVRIGVLSSLGKYILMLDADGATKIDCFSHLEDACNKDKYLVVFGSRNMSDINESKITRRWHRHLLNILFHKITNIIINTDLNDTQCGFKLFSRISAQIIFPSLHIKRWAFDIEIVMITKILKLEIKSIGVDWREVQGSKLSIFTDSFKMLLDILLLRILYFLGIWNVLNNKLDIEKKKS